MKKKLRVLISVYDKNGLTELVWQLEKIFRLEIVSTGGTARCLTEDGFKIKEVAKIIGFPEILNGRVKTLHPKIFGSILADKNQQQHLKELKNHGIKPLDVVVVNLYPFEKTIRNKGVTLEEVIEQIDIGGVALLRAAAKNFQSVIVVCDPKDYLKVLKVLKKDGGLSFKQRKKLAKKVFKLTSVYDALIADYF